MALRKEEKRVYTLFSVPMIIVIGALTIIPLTYMVYISTTSWNLARSWGTTFVGWDNYLYLLKDPNLIQVMLVTLYFVIFCVAGQMALGLGIAILLHANVKTISKTRSFFIFPMVLAPIIVGLIWRIFLNPQLGGLAAFLNLLRLPTVSLLSSARGAVAAIIIASIWEWFPFVMLILLGALESFPEEPFEAAHVDGASSTQVFWHITLPLLKPALLLALSFRVIESMKIFPLIFMMTGGGPGKSTSSIDYYAYLNGFVYLDIGYSSALMLIMLILVSVLCFSLFRSLFVSR